MCSSWIRTGGSPQGSGRHWSGNYIMRVILGGADILIWSATVSGHAWGCSSTTNADHCPEAKPTEKAGNLKHSNKGAADGQGRTKVADGPWVTSASWGPLLSRLWLPYAVGARPGVRRHL